MMNMKTNSTMMKMDKITFDMFCEKYCDGLYDSRFSHDEQCTGYKLLKQMVVENIQPANTIERERYLNNPTQMELFNKPDLKYMLFLHPILRDYVVENWNYIKGLKI